MCGVVPPAPLPGGHGAGGLLLEGKGVGRRMFLAVSSPVGPGVALERSAV